MDTYYFKTRVDTPFGLYEVVVIEQTADYAKQQARHTMAANMKVHLSMVQVQGNAVLCKGYAKRNMQPVKNCTSDGKQWAWCKRIK